MDIMVSIFTLIIINLQAVTRARCEMEDFFLLRFTFVSLLVVYFKAYFGTLRWSVTPISATQRFQIPRKPVAKKLSKGCDIKTGH